MLELCKAHITSILEKWKYFIHSICLINNSLLLQIFASSCKLVTDNVQQTAWLHIPYSAVHYRRLQQSYKTSEELRIHFHSAKKHILDFLPKWNYLFKDSMTMPDRFTSFAKLVTMHLSQSSKLSRNNLWPIIL